MTDRDLVARCPGCGKGKAISMALGQLLQCDLCRTVFHAPIAAEGETDPEALSDSFVVQSASVNGGLRDAKCSSTSTDSPVDRSAALGSGANATSTRSWGAHDLAMSSMENSSVENQADAAEKAVISVESSARAEQKAVRDPRTLASTWIATVVFGVGVTGLIAVVAAFLLTRSPSAGHEAVGTASFDQKQQPVEWINAAKHKQRKHPMTLHIERVKYGSLRAKDQSNRVVNTQDENLLGITIGIHNRGTRPRPFKNWYGHAFETGQGGTVVAELTDNLDQAYSLLKFDDVRRIEGQSCSDSIRPRETVQDTVVFMIPETIDRSEIEYLRLELPGAAVGVSESFRFQIPTSIIEGFEEW